MPTETGKLPLEIILDTAPALIWECDVAWVVRGHHDPVAWMQRYADRVTAIHVKDIAPAGECVDEDGWADVGHGTIDWKTIMDFVKARDQGGTLRHGARQSQRRRPLRQTLDRLLPVAGGLRQMSKTYGVGIIGCGNISTAYLRLAPLFKGLEMRAVADIDPEAAEARADEFGVRAQSVDDLLGQ